ncbi:MAG: Tat pathway signal protein [Bacteroidetes bacterium MedPE-SWsnd-G1]|nr:MAG: Tat pathway signal protein [Bacteroidetes bacterium MedPE-SWsnd-G1]
MDRRDTIKSLLLGSVAAGLALNGCAPDVSSEESVKPLVNGLYGRTPEEIERDEKLVSEEFFNGHELSTIAVLCDIILPKTSSSNSATEVGVTSFIEFIAKDLPNYKTPIRGGIMWLDSFSNRLYGKEFEKCLNAEQLAICDQIAYPEKTAPELKQGEKFFSTMRNLTMTGYFTSKEGLQDLGYKGNTPNVWDGIPEDVLKAHGMAYEKEWLAKCVDQSKRGDIAVWDDNGNLIS